MEQIKYDFKFPEKYSDLDKICHQIVTELYNRNFKVPRFRTTLTYEQNKTAKIWCITISDTDGMICNISFHGGKDYVDTMSFVKDNTYYNFSKYDDGSGHLYVYNGESTILKQSVINNSYIKTDEDVNMYDLMSRVYKEKGSFWGSYKGLKPIRYDTIVDLAIGFLNESILPLFKQYQVSILDLSYLVHPFIPIPEKTPEMFFHVNQKDQDRIEKYDMLKGDDKYAVYHSTDWVYIEEDNINWSYFFNKKLGVGEIDSTKKYKDYEIPGEINWDNKCVVKVNLNNAFGVTVIDHQVYWNKREELKDKTTDSKFTKEEMEQIEKAEQATRVPITDDRWKQYKLPIVLVSREIRRDEVTIGIPYKNKQ